MGISAYMLELSGLQWIAGLCNMTLLMVCSFTILSRVNAVVALHWAFGSFVINTTKRVLLSSATAHLLDYGLMESF